MLKLEIENVFYSITMSSPRIVRVGPHIRLDLAKPAIHSLLGCCGKDCGRIASLAVRHRQLIYLKRRAEAAESVSDIGSS